MLDREELVRDLLDEIANCDDEDRYRSLRDQIYGLGRATIPTLRQELTHLNFRRRMAAATNLGRLGDRDSAPALVGLLHDPQASVREMALFSLGILGDSSHADAISNSLDDYDADVRYRALVALSDLGYPQLEDALIRCMRDDSYGVREQALSQLRTIGSVKCLPVVLRALLEREPDMQQLAEETLDRLIPRMTREHYKRVRDELSPRERRLVLNHLEARNLQEVYGTLTQRLQLISPNQPKKRGLDKYGRVLNDDHELAFLQPALGRDDAVQTLVEHFTLPHAARSILLVGDAGVGKTALIHALAARLIHADEDFKILETNTSELISGTRYLGDWESKLKEMAQAILDDDAHVILYLTNPNDLLGAGAHSKSDENFADFFKPYLQRGQLQIIAECTEDDLKQGLSRDPGFLRLFRQIKLQPMDDAETLEVVEARLDTLSTPDGRPLRAEDGVLDGIVDFARSFFTRSVAPGRACDLQDALVDWASRHGDPEADAVVLRLDQVPACLSEVTGMSLDLLDDSVPLDLDATQRWFAARLIDQDHALDHLIDRLAIVKAGLGDPARPLGVYFLVGPTGVGKTYFTKLVAERLFGSPERMVRFDLSEYQGRFAVEKLIGSPHDKDREGLLTEAVRNQPFAVLLFDEFEKADPEIYHLFLQILDEGRLTDARGRTTDFRQTLIFLTSNLGASSASIAPLGFGPGADASRATQIRARLDDFFAPEFLNRLDEVVVFDPLSPSAMHRLVDIEVARALDRRGFGRRDLRVELTGPARRWLESHGFSQRFGARELKRTIERALLAPVSRLIVRAPEDARGRTIIVDASPQGLDIRFAPRDLDHAATPHPRPPSPLE